MFGITMSNKMPKNEKDTAQSYVMMNTEVRTIGEKSGESDAEVMNSQKILAGQPGIVPKAIGFVDFFRVED